MARRGPQRRASREARGACEGTWSVPPLGLRPCAWASPLASGPPAEEPAGQGRANGLGGDEPPPRRRSAALGGQRSLSGSLTFCS